MDLDWLPAQFHEVLRALAGAIRSREPSIRARVYALRLAHPGFDNDQLAAKLIRDTRVRVAGSRALSTIGRVAPLAIGMAVGAGFDWVAVSALGRAAIRYYGPGGPAARAPRLAVREDRSHVELGD